MALYVTAVDENSPAERFGLTVGCALLAIDGHPLNDALDYQFYTTPTSFSLEVCENEQVRKSSRKRRKSLAWGGRCLPHFLLNNHRKGV